MGMFDDVRVEYPLPDKEAQDDDFQTKDLDCLMDAYVITKDGRLVKHEWDTEETPQAEKPYPNAEPGTMQYLFGFLRKKEGSERVIDTEYHGMLHFYSGDYAYLAKFTDGTLVSIRRVGEIEGQNP